MTSLYEISEKYRVSVRKLRKMHKDGVLRCDGSGDPIADDIRGYLERGQQLTVKQLVALIERPGLLLEIGPRMDAAKAQVNALDGPEPASGDLWPELAGAAANEPDALLKLIAWAQATIPGDRPVNHHWLAVRLLLAVPENLRKYEFPRLNRVFLHMRQRPEFEGWWSVESQGKRRVTWYHQPKKGFDL